MDEAECWERLKTTPVGRIVVNIADQVEIFPVNYAADDGNIYVRTGEGTKLFGVVLNKEILFEIDGWDEKSGWSVILRANGEMLDRIKDIEYAESLGIHPWVPTRKKAFIKLKPFTISGRTFQFGPEPEDEWA